MLAQVLAELCDHEGDIPADTLCRQLDISPPMLDQMLDTLIRLGKLQPIEPPTPEARDLCQDCPIVDNCAPALEYKETRFRVVL